MFKVVLFGFMNNIRSLRGLELACKTDIRFMYLMDYEKPSHQSFMNFINDYLIDSVDNILLDINRYLIKEEDIDTSRLYIDGTKIEANSNKYSFVWKKATIKNREKLYLKIINNKDSINGVLKLIKSKHLIPSLLEYTPDIILKPYEDILSYIKDNNITLVYGKGFRKTIFQRVLELLKNYYSFLTKYIDIVDTCGNNRNSYSKTDKDATFMHMKEDYMKNGQLKPGYNLTHTVSSGYIMSIYVSCDRDDTGTLIPTIEKFKSMYGHYPKFPVADSGYGSLKNYRYLKNHNMELYLKYPMYSKEKDTMGSFTDNFLKHEDKLICPNNKHLNFKWNKFRYGIRYQIYECEDCIDCPYIKKCFKYSKYKGLNKKVELNEEWKTLKLETLSNLLSPLGNTLKKQRSQQVEGAFGVIKEDMMYRRLKRRGYLKVYTELTLIAIAFNLRKHHHSKNKNYIFPN